jgi:hypothetical protein
MINTTDKTGIFFRISQQQKDILNKVAKNEERTLQAVFNRALREYVEKYHKMSFDLSDQEINA